MARFDIRSCGSLLIDITVTQNRTNSESRANLCGSVFHSREHVHAVNFWFHASGLNER